MAAKFFTRFQVSNAVNVLVKNEHCTKFELLNSELLNILSFRQCAPLHTQKKTSFTFYLQHLTIQQKKTKKNRKKTKEKPPTANAYLALFKCFRRNKNRKQHSTAPHHSHTDGMKENGTKHKKNVSCPKLSAKTRSSIKIEFKRLQ